LKDRQNTHPVGVAACVLTTGTVSEQLNIWCKMAALLHKLLLISGLLSLFHAAYSAAQRKQCGTMIKNKIDMSF